MRKSRSETPDDFVGYGSDSVGNFAESYEKYFVPTLGLPHAVDLVAEADLRHGEKVLDVGCGTGIVSRLAAERVGSAGKVVGLDANAEMLDTARAVCPPSLEWIETSAESISLPDESFDVVLSQYALQFVPDKSAALKEILRVLSPGGQMVLTVPGKVPDIMEIAEHAIARHISDDAAGFLRAVFSLHDPDAIQQLVQEAGFKQPKIRTSSKTVGLPPPKKFLWGYINSTPISGMVASASEDRKEALERTVLEEWQPFIKNGGMAMDVETLTVTARR